MACQINTNTYPVISWKPSIEGTVTFTYDPTGTPTVKVVNLADTFSSDFWGFASSGSNDGAEICDANSIQGKLASELQSFYVNDVSIANAKVSGTYDWSGFGWPRWILAAEGSIVENTTIEFDTVDTARQFGFNTGSFNFSSITLKKFMDFNSAGYWAPRQRTVYDDRHTINPDVKTSVSTQGNTYKTVPWGDNKTVRRLEFPFVRPPYMYRYRSADFNFADPAGRSVDDTNNTFEAMNEAARDLRANNTSRQFRIYSSDGLYRIGYIIDEANVTDSSLNQEAVSSRAAYWNVSVVFRDEPGNGGV
jgi:hypothetical protein